MTSARESVKMIPRSILVLLLSLCLFHTSFAKDEVPVLIWNTNQLQGGVPAVSALQHYNYENFQAKYLEAFKPNNILLFLQDALSIEDLTSHTTELHHIKEWLESGHSLFLPNVNDAARLVHDLPAHGYNLIKLDHDAGLTLKDQDKNLVVVELPSTLTNPSRRRALQKADEVMENVISKIGEQRDFTIIFTGRKPSIDKRSDQYEERIRVSRSLKVVNDDELRILGWHYSECSMLFLRKNLTLNLYSKDNPTTLSVDIPESQAIKDTGDCQDDFNKLVSSYKEVVIANTTYGIIYVTYKFLKEPGPYWVLNNAIIRTDNSEGVFNLTSAMDQVPFGMSFACSQKFILTSSNTSFLNYDSAELVLESFQMQTLNQNGKGFKPFDGAWDCVGFFTVPIWCGLLVTFLLVFILTIGMFMLSDIKTMDRFDDPKGQSISVTTSE